MRAGRRIRSPSTIPLPSIKEQTEIVKRIEHLFAKADAIEAQYQSLKTKIERLPQAILAKAFKGELVEQLESDGSAAMLLEEIQRLKAELKGAKKTVKGKKKPKAKPQEHLRMVAEKGADYGKKN